MQFTAKWHDAQQSILLLYFPRYFDVTKLVQTVDSMATMIDETSAARIDLLLILNGAQISGGSELLSILHALSLRVPPQVESVIHVNASAFSHMLTRNIGLLNRRYHKLQHYTDTLEEALQLVEELRSGTIPFR